MRNLALAALLAAISFAASAQSPGNEVVVHRTTDDAGRITIAVFEQPKGGAATGAALAAEQAARAQGLPIYGATSSLPDLRPSAWAQYQPASRPSRQFEHVSGIVNPGYLR
ncbi:hypothetical protein BWI17_01495 [Betaproteobacteria bacterium GR16-43]|nr:hypothetical protein BWI17_01495 [Betaproteobacteria bacterium GR16-43]